jgi:hypothetical protein
MAPCELLDRYLSDPAWAALRMGRDFIAVVISIAPGAPQSTAVQLYEGRVRLLHYRPRLCGSGLCREGTRKFACTWSYCNGLLARTLELRAARSGFAEEMIFMAIRLFKVAGLAALVVFSAHSQNLSALDHAVAITTYLQIITEDDVDQRTRLDLLLAQKQVGREDVISQLGIDMDNIAKAEGAGLLSDALVDKAFADMCSRRSIAPADLMKALASGSTL